MERAQHRRKFCYTFGRPFLMVLIKRSLRKTWPNSIKSFLQPYLNLRIRYRIKLIIMLMMMLVARGK
jgi:hypothetical protein